MRDGEGLGGGGGGGVWTDAWFQVHVGYNVISGA